MRPMILDFKIFKVQVCFHHFFLLQNGQVHIGKLKHEKFLPKLIEHCKFEARYLNFCPRMNILELLKLSLLPFKLLLLILLLIYELV